ncbi:MAG: WhiB family transcriptional regulator [Actinomycetota bacterium]|nr:WhiB family transcriptional regulator [Actinomycetota bacterium]
MVAAITRSMGWAGRAACAGTFDESTNRGTWVIEPTAELSTPASVVAKLVICDGCAVRGACLRFALSAEFEVFGIWGGTTTIERKTLAPRSTRTDAMGYREMRRMQIERAGEILKATHDQRLRRWRRWAAEARRAHARGEDFRVPRSRITRPLLAALRSWPA